MTDANTDTSCEACLHAACSATDAACPCLDCTAERERFEGGDEPQGRTDTTTAQEKG